MQSLDIQLLFQTSGQCAGEVEVSSLGSLVQPARNGAVLSHGAHIVCPTVGGAGISFVRIFTHYA